jgi:hypothetical protein
VRIISTELVPRYKNPGTGIQELLKSYPTILKSLRTDKIWPCSQWMKVVISWGFKISLTLAAYNSCHRGAGRSNETKFYLSGPTLLDAQIWDTCTTNVHVSISGEVDINPKIPPGTLSENPQILLRICVTKVNTPRRITRFGRNEFCKSV